MTIHMKATEATTEVTTLQVVDETLTCDHSNEVIARYLHVLLFIMLNKVSLYLLWVTPVCDHSN